MADQKKWFKVWGSILVDPSLSGLSLADMGRWVRLGAYLTTCGERGKLTITNPAPMFLLAMEVKTLEEAKEALRKLPNVEVIDGPYERQDHGEDGQFQRSKVTVNNDNGSFIVTMKNWYKYQIDSTVVDRMKTLRSKRRVEEKREEERGGEQKSLHPRPPLSLWREKVGKLQDWERRERQGDLIGELESFHLPFEMQDQIIKEYFVEEPDGNDAVRGKSIDQQAAERFRTQGPSGLRKASEGQPILDRIRNLPKVPPETGNSGDG